MRIVINDMSFQFLFYDEETAIQKLHEFIYVCKELESGKLKNVEGLISDYIDPIRDIVPGCNLFKLLQRFETKDEQRYLLGLLTSRANIPIEEKVKCIMDGKEVWIWSNVFDNMMVSLLSEMLFEDSEVKVDLRGNEAVIRNISKKIHIEHYGMNLGNGFILRMM